MKPQGSRRVTDKTRDTERHVCRISEIRQTRRHKSADNARQRKFLL